MCLFLFTRPLRVCGALRGNSVTTNGFLFRHNVILSPLRVCGALRGKSVTQNGSLFQKNHEYMAYLGWEVKY